MTVAGVTTSAAAPAATKAAPWPTITPMLAMPKAWARRSFGTLTTNAVLAAIWYTPNAADTEKITSEAARPGRRVVKMSVPQVNTASGPIQLIRWRGRTKRVNSGVAIVVLNTVDASTRPVAIDPPPSRAAYGAAIPSGIV